MQPRRFLAQLVQTNAYQRSGWTTLQTSNNAAVPLELSAEQSRELRQWTTAHLRELVDNQTVLSEREATTQSAYETATEAWEEVQAQRAVVRAELDPAEATLIGEQKKATDATNLLSAAEKTQTETHTQATLLEEALAKLQQAAMVSGQEDPELKPAIDATNQRLTATREKLPGIDQQVVDARGRPRWERRSRAGGKADRRGNCYSLATDSTNFAGNRYQHARRAQRLAPSLLALGRFQTTLGMPSAHARLARLPDDFQGVVERIVECCQPRCHQKFVGCSALATLARAALLEHFADHWTVGQLHSSRTCRAGENEPFGRRCRCGRAARASATSCAGCL